MTSIAYRRCVLCPLVWFVLGLPLVAQTLSAELHKYESEDGRSAGGFHQERSLSKGGYASFLKPSAYLDPNPDVFDRFLAARQGKCILGAVSVAIGMIFLFTSRAVCCSNYRSFKNERTVQKYETIIRRDALLFLGSVALMLGAVYLAWSIFPIQ